MKKLLSILASVGLVATASTSVVSCTQSIDAKNVTVITDKDGNTTASWTETVKFNKHTTFLVHKDDAQDKNKITSISLIPYKLHLVEDVHANEDDGSHPQDMFKFGYKFEDGISQATATTDDSSWLSVANVYTSDGKTIPDEGIIQNDIVVKTTFSVLIDKSVMQDWTISSLKVALIRTEADPEENKGLFMNVNTHIVIDIHPGNFTTVKAAVSPTDGGGIDTQINSQTHYWATNNSVAANIWATYAKANNITNPTLGTVIPADKLTAMADAANSAEFIIYSDGTDYSMTSSDVTGAGKTIGARAVSLGDLLAALKKNEPDDYKTFKLGDVMKITFKGDNKYDLTTIPSEMDKHFQKKSWLQPLFNNSNNGVNLQF